MFQYNYHEIDYKPDLDTIHIAIIETGSLLADKECLGCRWDECENRCETCDHIIVTGCEADTLKIYFGLELSEDEKLYLDNLVAEHIGSSPY